MRYARGKLTRKNIGRICRVIDAYGIDDTSVGPLFHWNVEMVGSPGVSSDGRMIRVGQFPDKYLTPINPPAEHERVERDEEVTA